MSKKPKFTSGPWGVRETHTTLNVEGGPGHTVVARLAISPMSALIETGRANARLIAAAPSMYEALNVAADAIRSFDGGDRSAETGWKHDELCAAWMQITDALARAEGRDA